MYVCLYVCQYIFMYVCMYVYMVAAVIEYGRAIHTPHDRPWSPSAEEEQEPLREEKQWSSPATKKETTSQS